MRPPGRRERGSSTGVAGRAQPLRGELEPARRAERRGALGPSTAGHDREARRNQPQQAEPVQIAIDRDGTITIDDVDVAEAALPGKLAEIASQPQPEEGRRIYLRADRALDYGRVMRVMGELNRAGLNRVALVSVGPEDQ